MNWADFSRDDRLLVSASNDGTCRLWDLRSAQTVCVFTEHTQLVSQVSLSADGSRALSCSRDGTALIWSLADCKKVVSMEHEKYSYVTSAVFSSDELW